MSLRSALIALIAALACTALSLVLVPPRSSPRDHEQVATLLDPADLSRVRRIVVSTSAGLPLSEGFAPQQAELLLRPNTGWELIAVDARSGRSMRWPVMRERVDSLLRVLATADVTRSSERAASTQQSLTLADDQGWQRTLRFGEPGLGGRVAVTIDADASLGPALAPSEIAASLFDAAGPLRWIDVRPLGPLERIDRVKYTFRGGESKAAGAVVELTRSADRWAMLEPVAASADASRVEAALAPLAGLQAEGMTQVLGVGELPDGLDPNAPRIELSQVIRDTAGSHSVRQVVLRVGPSTEGARPTTRVHVALFESAGTGAEASLVASYLTRVPSGALEGMIGLSPGALLAPIALRVPARDIGSIEIAAGLEQRATVERTVEGWSLRHPPTPAGPGRAASQPLDAQSVEAIESLLRTLSQNPASEIRLLEGERPEPGQGRLLLTMRTVSGLVVDEIAIDVQPDGRIGEFVSVELGRVQRLYSVGQLAPVASRLAAIARRAPSPP